MVIPGSDGLRLRWTEMVFAGIQLDEPGWMPGAVDPDLEMSEESSDLGLSSAELLLSSGAYLLCLSCSFLLIASASLSTFCSWLTLQ